MRDRLTVPAGLGEDEARAAALASQKIRAHIGDRPIEKTFVVPDRLVSIVTRK